MKYSAFSLFFTLQFIAEIHAQNVSGARMAALSGSAITHSDAFAGFHNLSAAAQMKGARIYGIFKFDIRRNIDLWIRIAQWTYTDRGQISSGDSAIEGFRKTDCTAQLRVQF